MALLGPRQCGKTTLARMLFRASKIREITYFDLEDPRDLARLADPILALEGLRGIIVIDEVQRSPELFPILRVLADRPRTPARFLLLGSASPGLLRQSSETLAGRIRHLELTPFHLGEVSGRNLRRLWIRGGFPKSYLARSARASAEWRRDFVTTFLERDVGALGLNIPPSALRRLWAMLAHCHGQTLNYSELGRSLGASDTTVRRYAELLAGTFMIRALPPWHENLSKRQVRSPKIYYRDSGILHTFLDVTSYQQLLAHPRIGASWEGFAVEEIIRAHGSGAEAYFWATQQGAELDLLLVRGSQRAGFEIKHTSSPSVTKSMRIAMTDLRLARLTVVHPGRDEFPLAAGIVASGLDSIVAKIRSSGGRRRR